MDCIFCKILKGEIPSRKVLENSKITAFYDISPKAPIHILVIHREHTVSISETPKDKAYIFADIFTAITEIAESLGLNDDGYRVIINNGQAAGQEVFHLHAHILAGKENLGPMLA